MLDDHQHFLVEEGSTRLNLTLQEKRENAHESLLALGVSDQTTLLHLLVQVGLNILWRQLNRLNDLGKDFQRVRRQFEVAQSIVILLDLVSMRHANE